VLSVVGRARGVRGGGEPEGVCVFYLRLRISELRRGGAGARRLGGVEGVVGGRRWRMGPGEDPGRRVKRECRERKSGSGVCWAAIGGK